MSRHWNTIQRGQDVLAILLLAVMSVAATPFLGDGRTIGQEVGFNLTNPLQYSFVERRALLRSLRHRGISAIRVQVPIDERGAAFLLECQKAGMKVLLVMNLDSFASARSRMRIGDQRTKSVWSRYETSSLDPDVAMIRVRSFFSKLGGTAPLIGIEVGNEINYSSFNGDFAASDRGHHYDLAWLMSKKGSKVRRGLDVYVEIVKRVRVELDRVRTDGRVSLISAGLSVVETNSKTIDADHPSLVNAVSTSRYLASQGLAHLIDGTAIHVYPWKSMPGTVQGDIARARRFVRFGIATCEQFPTKPCWLTEWGFSHDPASCSSDTVRLIKAFDSIIAKSWKIHNLVASFYYSWNGDNWMKGGDPYAVSGCIDASGEPLTRYLVGRI